MSRQPSHLPGVIRLLRRTLERGKPDDRSRPVPARRLAVERREMRLDPKRVERFVRATHGTDIEALGAGTLPPTYVATWETALALDLLAAAGYGLPTAGVIHLRSELVQVRPLHRDHPVTARLELEAEESSARGTILSLTGRSWNGAGQLCTESTTSLLLRDGDGRGKASARAAGEEGAQREEKEESWREIASWRLPAAQGRRYARASGDFNPIHLWALTARPLGFRRPILQGFCTQALVAHALIARLLGGEPAALRRLGISFRAPLPLPSTASLLVADSRPETPGRFRVVDASDARRVFADGEFVGLRS